MSAEIIFRPLLLEETDDAARLYRVTATVCDWYDPQLHTPDEDRAFYRDTVFAKNAMLGAFGGEGLLGYLAWRDGWVDHLYVRPSHQSKGIGGALLDRVKDDNDELRLWTFQMSHDARRFYERHDFVAEEFTDGSGNEEKLPDVRYHWKRN